MRNQYKQNVFIFVLLLMMLYVSITASVAADQGDAVDTETFARMIDAEFAYLKVVTAKFPDNPAASAEYRTPITAYRHPDRALPFLMKYLNDPNDRVRLWVNWIAQEMTRPEAITIFTVFILDKNSSVREHALIELEKRKMEKALEIYGGLQLRDNLLSQLKSESLRFHLPYLLLGYCPKDEMTVQRLRDLYPTKTGKTIFYDGREIPTVYCLNMVLADLGDKPAIAWVLQMLQQDTDYGKTMIIDWVSMFDNPVIIGRVVEEMKNTAHARNLGVEGINRRERYCDVATSALLQMTKIDIGVTIDEIGARRPAYYTDAELETAYAKIKAHFK